MSKVLRVVGAVASIAAVIPGPHQPFAAAVAVAANIGSQVLQKPPSAKGQVNDWTTGANNPQPYLIGRSYAGGVIVHDVGYGGEVDGVENPYRFTPVVYSCCGPVESLESVQFDFTAITFSGTAATGYYADYLWRDFQLGLRPESDALTPNFASAPGWSTDHKLSSYAAIAYSFKWSKKGKRFAGGQLPIIGAIWEGVKVYDPRLDDTYPGGAGAHRIDDEATWEYSRNPALHALAYAYGRYVEGVKVFGVDLGVNGIDLATAVAWANVCDANGWNADGTIYEPGDKWNNLKRICEAGGAEPVISGGLLRFDYQAPRSSLATIGRDDLADGPVSSQLGRGWKDRHNTLVARYRSEDHQWNYVQAEAIQIAAAVTADGEEKTDERQWDLVTDIDHVAQLATYDLYQRREAGPFSLSCKPHMRIYGPGDCLTLASELGAHPDGAIKVIVRQRTTDPLTGIVRLEFEQESDDKHTAALAATGVAPPPVTLPDSEDIDDVNGGNANNQVVIETPPVVTYDIDPDGTVSAGQLPDEIVPLVTLGGTDIRDDDDVTYSIATSGVTATVNNTLGDPDKGKIEITALAVSTGWIDLSVTVDGVAYPARRIVVMKQGAVALTAEDIAFTPAGNTAATDVQAAIEELDEEAPGRRGAVVKKTADQTAANYTAGAAVAWDGEVYDTASIHDTVTNNSRLTVPSGVSKIRVGAKLYIQNVGGNNACAFTITKNGSTGWDGEAGQADGSTSITDRVLTAMSPVVTVTPGDYFEVVLTATADTSIDIIAARSWFTMEIVA